MGNTCNKFQEIPSYDMAAPQTNQISHQIPLPQIDKAPPVNTRFRTFTQKSDLIKSRIKNIKKTKGFSKCEIAPKEGSFITKFNKEIIKQAHPSQVLTIKLAPIDISISKKFSRFFMQMKYLNQVKTLRVSFEGLTERHLKRFCKNLKYMKLLTHLEIKLVRYAVNARSFFSLFISGIKCLKNLTQFSFHFPSIQIEDKFLPGFSRKIRFLTLLKTFKLHIENNVAIQCLSLIKMLYNLRNLKLSTIALNMHFVKCENPKISEFLAAFKHFASSLEGLSLNFNLQGPRGLIADYTDFFKDFDNLKHLNVNFNLDLNTIYFPMKDSSSDVNKRSAEIVKAIASEWNLKERPTLTHVKFRFLTGNFSLSDPESFINFIQKMASADLRFLTEITFHYTKKIQFASHFYLEAQRNSLSRLPVTCNMKDDNIQEISNFIAFLKPIQHLYSFHLGFNWDDSRYQINENSIQHLMKNIKEIPSVTGFSLNLKKCFRIDEGLFEKFCSCLLDLQAVDDLSLGFSGCIQISDDCLVTLGETIMKMKNLKRLSLVFYECYLIQNEGIKALGARLLAVKSLEYVKINCDECFKLNSHERGLLANLVRSVPKVEIHLNKFLIS